jgi:hypothetical protein
VGVFRPPLPYVEGYHKSVYLTTGKEQPIPNDSLPMSSDKEYVYFWLAKAIEETFPQDDKVNILLVYREITGPKGLSYDDTTKLVRNATKAGYLKRKQVGK